MKSLLLIVHVHDLSLLFFPPARFLNRHHRDILLQFLQDPVVKVRKQAVLTCCQMLVQPGKPQFVVGPSADVSSLLVLFLCACCCFCFCSSSAI